MLEYERRCIDCLVLRSDQDLDFCSYCYRNYLFFIKSGKQINVFEARIAKEGDKKMSDINLANIINKDKDKEIIEKSDIIETNKKEDNVLDNLDSDKKDKTNIIEGFQDNI